MTSPLDTIAYLARSDHRVEVLEAICTTPRTREAIRDLTDASRVTAGRIIADLEERDWIIRNGKEYAATASGRFVSREFTRLVKNLETYADLPPVVEWFPEGQPSFDLCLLDDATVTTADEGDLIAPIRRALELMDSSDHVRVVANGASREFVKATRDAVEVGSTHTILVPPETIDALQADPELRADTLAMLASGRATLLRYDGEGDLPVMQIGDLTVGICSGDHQAMVETDDPSVYDWAVSYFASLRADTTQLSPESFDDVVVAESEAYVD